MAIVCPKCKKAYRHEPDIKCPKCGYKHIHDSEEQNKMLWELVKQVKEERAEKGIEGLLKGICGMIIRVEEGALAETVKELVSTTSLEHVDSFVLGEYSTAVLEAESTPTFLVREGKAKNHFRELNKAPRTMHKHDTRLESFVVETEDIDAIYKAQKSRGVEFIAVVHGEDFSYAQTAPSPHTNNSIAYIQFKNGRDFRPKGARDGIRLVPKPDKDYVGKIGLLDHTATRLTHADRNPAISEIMWLTGYNFAEAIYVKVFNSITNVTRLQGEDFAMVITSGIKEYTGDPEVSEPTEKFVKNYGKRVHHLAWQADPIEDVFEGLKEDGQEFLLELLGGKDEGLKQTFTRPSQNTFLVNEYIYRYGDFRGFFTKKNVTRLTEATDWQ